MGRKTFRKIIVTPELLEQVNEKNKKLQKSFLKEKNTRSSDTTIKAYESDLNIFFCWNLLYNENKHFIDIKKLEFADFFSYVTEELQWGSARFGRMRACLSSLSIFIEKFFDADYPNFRNVILKVVDQMPKNPKREKTVFTDDEIKDLLKHLSETDAQQACWLALAISSGARFSELFLFDIDIIDENNTAFNGIFIETKNKIKTKGRTKSGKLINKYIIKDLFIPYYKVWIEQRKEIMSKNNQIHNKLFIKNDGTPAVHGTIRSWINTMNKYIDKPIYPHCFRHYLTSYLSRLGLPNDLIKEIFGWESLEMVTIYNDNEAKNRNWAELENLKKSLEQ